MDFLFLELYIKKKYNQKVEEYFNIHKMSVSGWRIPNKIPKKRLEEFYKKEGKKETIEYFKQIYPL